MQLLAARNQTKSPTIFLPLLHASPRASTSSGGPQLHPSAVHSLLAPHLREGSALHLAGSLPTPISATQPPRHYYNNVLGVHGYLYHGARATANTVFKETTSAVTNSPNAEVYHHPHKAVLPSSLSGSTAVKHNLPLWVYMYDLSSSPR